MASTGLPNGPHPRGEIDKHVPDQVDGAYALGRIDPKDGGFFVDYVGRSDRNKKDGVRGRLHQHDGKPPVKNWTHFKWKEIKTEEAAYDHECEMFHDFPNGANVNHPPVPPGTQRKCPRCDHPNPPKKKP